MSGNSNEKADADINVFNEVSKDSPGPEPVLKPKYACADKLCHPPTPVPDFRGLPTEDARSQVLLNFRGASINNVTNIYRGAGKVVPIPAKDWSGRYAFLITNGLYVRAIGMYYDTVDLSWKQDLTNVIFNTTYNFRNWASDGMSSRTIYKSTTIALNVTSFNDTGLCAACQFNPGVLDEANPGLRGQSIIQGTATTLSNSHPKLATQLLFQYMKQYHELTHSDDYEVVGDDCEDIEDNDEYIHPKVVKTAIKMFDKWIVDSKLKPAKHLVKLGTVKGYVQIFFMGSGLELASSGAVSVPDTSSVMQMSARSYCEPAKKGCFMVSRLNTISPAWTPCGTGTFDDANNGGLLICYFAIIDTTGLYHLVPFTYLQSPGVTTAVVDTRWTDQMTFGWITFDGLVPNSNVASDTALSNLFIVKTMSGVEIQPASMSPWSPLAELAPRPDLKAMQAIQQVFYDMADAQEASKNFAGLLGTVARGALNGLMSVMPTGPTPTSMYNPNAHAAAPAQPQIKVEEVDEFVESNKGWKTGNRRVARPRSNSTRRAQTPARSTTPRSQSQKRGFRGGGRGRGRGGGRRGRKRSRSRKRSSSRKSPGSMV